MMLADACARLGNQHAGLVGGAVATCARLGNQHACLGLVYRFADVWSLWPEHPVLDGQ